MRFYFEFFTTFRPQHDKTSKNSLARLFQTGFRSDAKLLAPLGEKQSRTHTSLVMGYFTSAKEKALETFPVLLERWKEKLASGKRKSLDFIATFTSSSKAPIEKHRERCEDIEKIWDAFVDSFVGTLHAQGGAGCASRAGRGSSFASSSCSSDGDVDGTKMEGDERGRRRAARERLVTIGDLHGDLEQTKRAFRACSLTDSRDKWIGGKTIVVQVGDQLDRGPDEVAVMYFLERVAEEAERSGGELVRILGNHETLNIAGRFRYAQREGCADFTRWRDRQKIGMEMKKMCFGSEKQMERRYRKKKEKNWCAYETGEKRHEKLPSWIREDDVHSINRWKAVCPGGEFTKRFFSGKNVAERVGSTLFVHAGVLEHHALYGLENINKDIREWAINAENPRGVPPSHVQSDQSIVWARDYAHTDEERCDCAKLSRALRFLPGVERVVVGHTIQKGGGGATAACDGKVLRVDVGMSRGCGGNTSEGVEILNDGEKITRMVDGRGRQPMTGVENRFQPA